ncbi:glucose 1-dehydrogenase [Rhodococcus sp. IEGM 1370]|uniref:SDR family NAD(P)-dependent oxidoreductase n=1 Tax=Rhodococcus sp. IEGM 1370 TaxID=3082222 RepID=UPI00295430CB|nr:glucose 1-dehydrogenase [Rhodococcus sp. IEGM 1370]MDV8079562.1 glucose 1-dehydrogenase [Rhodococcus sp. IEGM 1370]
MTITYNFTDKVVLITGGGSGIGLETARAFGLAGARVAVADISADNGNKAVADIRAAGGIADYFRVDVGDDDSVRSMVDAVVSVFGGLDIAHNNAGIEGRNVPLCDVPSDNWRRVIDVDLSSVFYCLKAEIPAMIARGGGVIVNTASASGLIGGYNLSAYTAAKHGVVGLTKAAAMDYGSQNIRINALCPGPIDTPFIDDLPSNFRERLVFATPLGRLGSAKELAQAVMWLCSEGSTYVTGHALAVDGGTVLGGTGTRFDDLI